MSRETVEDAIIAYKTILAQIIDNRPSGTRQRLAAALGKHRSFVTQVTSPAYSTPPDFGSAEKLRQLSLIVPDLGDEKKNRLFDDAIEELVRSMAKLVGTMD